jgi:HSP20 family protein
MATQPIVKKSESENVVPFRPLSMMEEMERMFENFMPQSWLRPWRMESSLLAETLPQVDVLDQDDKILVRAALPGVNKDDLEVSTTDHTITIRGCTSKETKEEKSDYYRREIRSGSFLRTVALPASVDEKRIKAVFKDGLLEVTLPKLEGAKRHAIPIQTD